MQLDEAEAPKFKFFKIMKKIFTLVCAALLSTGLFAQETIFSATPKAAFSVEKYDTIEVTSEQVNLAGGHLFVLNGSKDKLEIKTQNSQLAFALTGTATGYLAVLDKKIEEGDTISAASLTNGAGDNNGRGIWVTTAETRPSTAPACVLLSVSGTGKEYAVAKHVVEKTDDICGKDSIYIWRATGNSTYFKEVQIIRPAATEDPVIEITITGLTECFVGEKVTMKASANVKADTIWWTDKYGQKLESLNGTFEFSAETAGEFTFTAWAENKFNTQPATKQHTIIVNELPAPCVELYPATSGDKLSVGSIVTLTEASKGGSIKVTGMKNDKSSIEYNTKGLRFAGGGADSVLVTLDHFLKEGSVILLTMQSAGDGIRGLNILANNKKVVEATWNSKNGEENTVFYIVKADDGLVGLNAFGLQRNQTVILESVKVAACGAEVPEIPTALDNTDAAVKATKVVRNGQLLIEKNGEVYNVLGARIR